MNESDLYRDGNVYDINIYRLLRECKDKRTSRQYAEFVREVYDEITTREEDDNDD